MESHARTTTPSVAVVGAGLAGLTAGRRLADGAGDEAMAGNYFGYDGPCPPWNDAIVHHYHFTLYAVDFERCPVGGEFTGRSVLEAMEGHILETTTLTGTYSLNPDLAV